MAAHTVTGEDYSGSSGYRQYGGRKAAVVRGIGIFLPLLATFQIFKVAGVRFGLLFYPEQYHAIFLFLVLTMVFLLFPARRGSPTSTVRWYNVLLIAGALAPTTHFVFAYPPRVEGLVTGATPLEQAFFIVLVLVIGEAVRRTLGYAVLGVTILPIAYAKFAYLLPGLWGAPDFSLERLTEYIYLSNGGIFGPVLGIAATIIIIFLTFGEMLRQAGTATLLTNCAMSLAGGFKGGPAKVAVLASAAMATMSGSPSANVGAVGVITIPLMKKLGYRDYFAGAVETISSVGGVITPPVMGAVAFIIADITGAGYAAVCIAAMIPAILYYVSVYFQVHFEAGKLNLTGIPRDQLPSFRLSVARGWYLLLPIVLLVVLLMVMRLDPTEAAAFSILGTLMVSWFRKDSRMTLRKTLDGMAGGSQASLMVVPSCAAAGIIMGAVALTGVGINLGALMRDAAGGNVWLLAVLAWVVIYISGMAIGELILYIVLAIVLVPAFVAMDVPPLAAHLFIFYMSISMFITPPNCPAVFIACSIARSGMWKTAFQAMKLGIVAFIVPFAILFDPAYIFVGPPDRIALAVVTGVAGCILLAAAIEGYMLRKAALWQRVLFAVAGIGLFAPSAGGHLLGIVALVPLAFQLKGWRSAGAARPAAGRVSG